MAESQTIDISRVVDGQRFGAFNANILIVTLILMACDGYDIAAVAYSAPALMKAWNIPSMAVLGPVLSANMFGFWLGAPLFGYIGDRLGRKIAIVSSTITFGLFSLAATQAGSLNEMFWLRVLAGIGLSGLFPLGVAINNEFAPRRLRATLVTLMAVGTSAGGMLAGPVAAWLIPQYGWQVIFLIGGVVPIILAIYAYFALPESIKFLALQPHRDAEVVRLLTIMKPDIWIPSNARFIVGGEENASKVSVSQLFAGNLATLTVLLWLVFMIVGISFYFFSVWMVTILNHLGIPVARAALAGSMYQLGGMLGALALCRPMDRYGLSPIIGLFVISIPSILALDVPGLPPMSIFAIMFMIGFSLLGLKSVINTAAGMVYPTALRSSGVGWAVGVGAVGSVISINAAGLLIGVGLPIEKLFMLVALLMAVGTIGWFAIMRLYASRLNRDDLWLQSPEATAPR
jgi:MFS transporter, AAHS family, 4-hydroxybenzoate transporter